MRVHFAPRRAINTNDACMIQLDGQPWNNYMLLKHIFDSNATSNKNTKCIPSLHYTTVFFYYVMKKTSGGDVTAHLIVYACSNLKTTGELC